MGSTLMTSDRNSAQTPSRRDRRHFLHMAMAWGASCVLVVAGSGSRASAEIFPPTSGSEVHVAFAMEPAAALDKEFVERVRRHVETSLADLLGADRNVRRIDLPKFQQWLDRHRMDELTSDAAMDFGGSPAAKTMLLALRHDRGAYRLSAAECEGYFGELGPLREASVVQRSMVAENLARMAVRSFTPVGEVVGRNGTSFVVSLQRQKEMTSTPDWPRVRPGSILRLYREGVRPSGEIDQQARRDQFLLVEKATSTQIVARSVIQTASDPWFQGFGNPRTRFLVRGIDPRREPITVRVVLGETGAMREGCEVYATFGASLEAKRQGKLLGLTNARGEFTFVPESADLCLLNVKYDSLEFAQAIVPGVTPSPRTITVASRTPRLEIEMQLTQLHGRLGDAVIVMNDFISRRDAASNAGDSSKAAEYAKHAREAANLDQFRKDLAAVEAQAKEKSIDLASRFADFRSDISRIERQFDPQAGARAVNAAQSRTLQEEMKQTADRLDWPRLLTLYEQYVRLNPDDKDAAKTLAELRADLTPQSPQHAAARKTVDSGIPITRIDDLIREWKELRPALDLLIQRKDKRWLLKASRGLAEWQKIANADAVRVDEEIKDPKTANDEARLKQLDRRLDELEPLLMDIKGLISRVADELR